MTVVVGVDGQESSLIAVRVAAREAALRKTDLRIAHAFIWNLITMPIPPSYIGVSISALQEAAEGIVAEAREVAVRDFPDLIVRSEITPGFAAALLILESQYADLLVIGDRGLGPISGILVGTIAVQLAGHAHCPVLVARGEPRTTGPVVVGIDVNRISRDHVEFAFEEARLRGTSVVAVHTWQFPKSSGPDDMLPLVYDAELVEEWERVNLDIALEVAMANPDVEFTPVLVRGNAAKVLLKEAEEAQLVVVGSRGRGGFKGLMLGSVSQKLIYHSPCPVVVFPRNLSEENHE